MKEEILEEFIQKHQKWLKGQKDGKRADLTGADLTGADLTGANLRGADLREADLTGADLRGANLRKADLRGANLRKADLTGANLRKADLTGADLRKADLRGADLTGANLRGADLREADLTGADLRKADLTGANLTGGKGLLNPIDFLFKNFEKSSEGIFVYKTFGSIYSAPTYWDLKEGSIIQEECNYARTDLCGCGINIAPLAWVRKQQQKNIWQLLIRWEWLPGVVVPYNTDGKIRCAKAEIIGLVDTPYAF